MADDRAASLDLASDEAYIYDEAEQKALRKDAPWTRDPMFFKRVRISAIALVKMVSHARSGGSIEVMGLMQGRVTADGEIIVMDSFALPVEGTETRVNAGAEAYEYMIQFKESSKLVSRPEEIVGWYHSHPGYGCWLSGIDVGTQKENQQYQDPFLAVVIDPNRTVSSGTVDIGAFRTLPPDYVKEHNEVSRATQQVPLSKIEDFGVHADSYYPLEISHFCSSADIKVLQILSNKSWTTTLSHSSLLSNKVYTTERLEDLTEKFKRLNEAQSPPSGLGSIRTSAYNLSLSPSRTAISSGLEPTSKQPKKKLSELEQLSQELEGMNDEEQQGLLTQKLKSTMFIEEAGEMRA